MAVTYTKSFGFTNTKAASPIEVNIPQLDYASDWTLKSQTADTVVLVNTTTPVDQPYTCRIQIQDVGNVYNGTDIDPVLYGPVKRGKSLLASSRLTMRITNDTTGEITDYPIQINTVIKWPVTSGIAVSDIKTALFENWGQMFDAADDNTRLGELLRGALRPDAI